MKMDIEFAEFIVLPDLVISGAMCKSIHSVFGEFHFRREAFPMSFADNNLVIPTLQSAKSYVDYLLQAIRTNPSCNTIFTIGDDETHYSDGVPWPTPPEVVADI
jgi:hypothetical protein